MAIATGALLDTVRTRHYQDIIVFVGAATKLYS